MELGKEWLSAGLACALADTLFNPLEVIKTRKQLRHGNSFMSIAKEAVQKDGFFHGLMRPGVFATWMRGMSYTGFRIGCYPKVRDLYSDKWGKDTLLTRISAGATTGAIGSIVFAPIDVVRIRMQSYLPYENTFIGFSHVKRDGGGYRALWRGALPSALRATLLSGAQLATYDTTKRYLRQYSYFVNESGAESLQLFLISSLLSGFVAQTVAMPADAMRTLIMARASKGLSPFSIISQAFIQEGGFRIFFRGYVPAVLRQGPVMLVQMPLVEYFRVFFGLKTI